MSKKNTPVPSLIAETFMSVFKVFLIFVILNNIIWAIFYFRTPSTTTGDSHIEINQNGNRDIVNKNFK